MILDHDGWRNLGKMKYYPCYIHVGKQTMEISAIDYQQFMKHGN